MYDYHTDTHDSKYAILENTWKNSHPTPLPTSPRLSRANSDISLYAPVRRRSLIRTPGVATRAPSLSERGRRSTSNLASAGGHTRNTSFDPGPESISVLPKLPEPGQIRAKTPSKFDYRQLGSMEFGSLRITNGVPSPASDRKRTIKDTAEVIPAESGGKKDAIMGAEARSEERTTGPKIVEPRPISAAITPITATFLKLESADPGTNNESSDIEKDELETFLPGLNFGSFSLMGSEPLPSEILQTTSKNTAIDDKLFDEESRSDTSQADETDARDTENAQSRANGGKHNALSKTGTTTRPDSGFVSSPTSEISQKPFSKTDSGYSSNVSLRSLRNSKGPATDKELPPCPVESSNPSMVKRSSSSASFLGDLHLPSPRPISLESLSASSPPEREAPPPPPPPKDVRPFAPVAVPSMTKSASIPLLNASVLKAKSEKRSKHRPSFLKMARNRANGPGSPNSIQLSPALSNASGSNTLHRAAVQKPGPLRRLLSVTSRKGSRGSLGSLSFRNSGLSSNSRVSARAETPIFGKSSKDSRQRTEPGLSAMESVAGGESSQTAPAPPESSVTEGIIRRHRSFQSIPATIVNVAASVLPSRKSLRRSLPSSAAESDDEDDDDMTEVNEPWSGTSSSESDAPSPEDYTRDSLMRNGFDPSFMAMTSARDAYFSPAPSRAPSRAHSRTGSLASPSVDVRLAELYARSNTESPASFDNSSASQNTSIPEHPYMHSSHPLLRSRSVVQLRVPAPLRPHSTPSRLHRSQSQTFSLQANHEFTYSYPPATSMGRSSFESGAPSHAAQPYQRQPAASSQENEDSVPLNGLEKLNFPPRGPGSHHSRTNSVSSQASSIGVYVRSMSATPYSEQQRRVLQRPSSANPHLKMSRQDTPLRHRASYEGQASKARMGQSYRRQSPNLWTSTHYEQLQMQYGGTAFDPRQGWYPPYVPRSGHYRNRSMMSQGRSNAPYRVLHSYYSPAYRHVPIWG